VRTAVEHHVLVDLVAYRHGIVIDAKSRNELEFRTIEDFGARIHRGVEEDQLGAGAEGGRQLLARQVPCRWLEPDQPRDAPCPAHDWQVGIVERFDQHDFIARLDQAEQAIAKSFGRP